MGRIQLKLLIYMNYYNIDSIQLFMKQPWNAREQSAWETF